MTIVLKSGCVAWILAFWFMFDIGAVRATTHYFPTDQNLPEALKKTADGDTVMLEKGEFLGNLIIEKRLTVIGIGLPVLRADYRENVLRIVSPGVVIDGLEVSESETRLMKDFACILIEADSVEIRNCLVSRPLHGIYVKGGSFAWIHDNRIVGREDLIDADRGNGIHMWNSRRNIIEGNEILHTRDGIYFSFADSTQIRNNYVHHTRYGLHYMYSNVNTFEDNLFELNVAGAALMYSNRIVFRRNIFARCRGFRAYGILYQSMENSLSEHNLVLDNSRGVFFNNSDSNIVRYNDIADNDLAIQMNGQNEGSQIYGNNFLGNLTNLLTNKDDLLLDWAKEGKGNYWSNYTGYDLEGDGIGDVPHKLQNVFQIIETDVPEVRFYLLSPTAELLEVAERALPILGKEAENDTLPLFRRSMNDRVPWEQGQKKSSRGSIPAVMAVIAATMLPFSLLHWLSKGRR